MHSKSVTFLLGLVAMVSLASCNEAEAQTSNTKETYAVKLFSEQCVDQRLNPSNVLNFVREKKFSESEPQNLFHYYSGILPAEIRIFDISRSSNETAFLSLSVAGKHSGEAGKIYFEGGLGRADSVDANVLHWPPSKTLPRGAIGQIWCSVIIENADIEHVFEYLNKVGFYFGYLDDPDHTYEQNRTGRNNGQYEEFSVWLLGEERKQIGLLSVTGENIEPFIKVSFLRYVLPDENREIYNINSK
jgi:hypothetical protein